MTHILIARNSRGLPNPAAALSSPTETHAAASGIFRSSASPSGVLEDTSETDDFDSELSGTEEDEVIEIHENFTKHCKLPGTVKIAVENSVFWSVSLSRMLFMALLTGHLQC